MAGSTLSLLLRPRTFGDFFGMEQITSAITKQVKSGRMPTAWLFIGPAGSGKTTLARILAASFQCTHNKFGYPCATCRMKAKNKEFCTEEVPVAEQNKVADMHALVDRSLYAPTPGSPMRVIILDEAHRITTQAQAILLKHFEDFSPSTTVWIATTTEPHLMLDTLKSRCMTYKTRLLRNRDVEEFIKFAAEKGSIKRDLSDFVDFVHKHDVSSPRVILMCLEKFASGLDPADALLIGEVNTKQLCRNIMQGDWSGVKRELRQCEVDDGRLIRGAVMGYLKAILLNPKTPPKVSLKVAQSVKMLARITYDEAYLFSDLVATLHLVTKRFP